MFENTAMLKLCSHVVIYSSKFDCISNKKWPKIKLNVSIELNTGFVLRAGLNIESHNVVMWCLFDFYPISFSYNVVNLLLINCSLRVRPSTKISLKQACKHVDIFGFRRLLATVAACVLTCVWQMPQSRWHLRSEGVFSCILHIYTFF